MYSRKRLQIYGLIINYGLNMIILNKLATSNFIPKHNENTALTHIHERGFKMLPFAGYNMPITYEGIMPNMKRFVLL
jgi:hypothetical protein